MKTNLPIIKQNSQIALHRSKSLILMTNKILLNDKYALINDDWIQRLWDWADENMISDYGTFFWDEGCDLGEFGIPRQKDDLVKLKIFSFRDDLLIKSEETSKLVPLNPIDTFDNKKMLLPIEIGKLVHLTELCLPSCNLISIPKEIGSLTQLTRISFDFNELTVLPNEIGYLHNLEGFLLSYNNLDELPEEIGSLSNLKTLTVNTNMLTELPETIGNLINLETLFLNTNLLTKLPDQIVNLNNLKKLSLENNPHLVLTEEQERWIDNLKLKNCIITQDEPWMKILWNWADENYIPDHCWCTHDIENHAFWGGLPRNKEGLTSLTDFSNFSDNQMVEVPNSYNHNLKIPKEIGNLVNLIEIELWGYDLIEIPKEIENLINLTRLSIDSWNIPKEICNIPNLTVLFCDCYGDNLTPLPKEIKNLTKLSTLSIFSESMTEIPDEICNLTKLKKLDLRYNENLILSFDQKNWILDLIKNGCNVEMDDDLFDRNLIKETANQEKFNLLIQKIYDSNYDLGDCFERNVSFEDFRDDQLIWTARPEGEDRKLLINHWELINILVQDVFGLETEIIRKK